MSRVEYSSCHQFWGSWLSRRRVWEQVFGVLGVPRRDGTTVRVTDVVWNRCRMMWTGSCKVVVGPDRALLDRESRVTGR